MDNFEHLKKTEIPDKTYRLVDKGLPIKDPKFNKKELAQRMAKTAKILIG